MPEEIPNSVPPDESKNEFNIALQRLKAAFTEWTAVKEEQFQQILTTGWSDEHEDVQAFLNHLEHETKRLYGDVKQTRGAIMETASAAESVETKERLLAMKPLWDKLRAEGVPIDQRPLHADLPWPVQFQAQAEADPTGKDMEWWLAEMPNWTSM